MNKNKQKIHRHRQQYSGYQSGRRWGRQRRLKGVKYNVTEGPLDLDGEHTMQYSDDALQNCTLAAYIILLTNVTPIHLIKF